MVQDDWTPLVRGGSIHVRELSKTLANEFDHEIDIYTRALAKDGIRHTETETLADGRVTVYRLPPTTEYWNPVGRASSVISPTLKLLRKSYDVVHGHTFLPAVPTYLSTRFTDAASVFTVHGTALNTGVGHDTTAVSNLKRLVERLFVCEFSYDHVISVNQRHLDLLGDAHDSVSCIPNGVDVGRFDVDVETVPGRILFVGRLAPKKRVCDLLDAYSTVLQSASESELIVVGTGPREDALKEQAADRGIADRVRFEGYVSDEKVAEYYASAQVFALPSVWEGHPLTLLESWASGTPVVATAVEGIEEFVSHRENGYLVSPESPSELADALLYAVTHSDETRTWGENARELAVTEFSWEATAARTDEVYRKSVSGTTTETSRRSI
jgi:glycosyltransferase involved in cell wall biosynthesis